MSQRDTFNTSVHTSEVTNPLALAVGGGKGGGEDFNDNDEGKLV